MSYLAERRWAGSWWPPVILFLATVAAYINSLHGPFIFDDLISIAYNPCVQSLTPFTHIFQRASDLDITPWGRPVLALSLALNYSLGKLDVVGFHLFNISLHLANGIVLYALQIDLLRNQGFSRTCQTTARPLSFFIALLWLLHPLGTSATTYIIQRAEALMSFFYLLTLWSGVKFWANPSKKTWSILAILFCCLGMLSKESMFSAPIAVLLIGRVYFREAFKQTLLTNRIWLLGLLSSWAVLALVMHQWPRSASVGDGSRGMNGWEYLLIQTQVIPHYFRLVFWPVGLSLNYPQRVWPTMESVPPGTWPLVRGLGDIWPEAAILAVLLAFTFWLTWKRPGLGLPLLLVFIILGPTSSIIPITTSLAADHRMYLPSAALIGLFVILGHLFVQRAPRNEIKAATSLQLASGILLALLLLGLTLARNTDYQDGTTVWQRSLAQHPRDALGWNELGSIYWIKGRTQEAAEAFARGSQVCDTYLLPRSNWAVTLWNLGNKQAALDQLKYIISREPNNINALANLGLYLSQEHELEGAKACYRHLLQVAPDNIGAKEALKKLE